jgi:hypothetical protein
VFGQGKWTPDLVKVLDCLGHGSKPCCACVPVCLLCCVQHCA